jgi:transcription initiation factor TFIIIB Brf1 subunit/transcription initiation factor TFIIB
MEFKNFFCQNCRNHVQEDFIIDHHMGTAICMRCGAELSSFQLFNVSYSDYQNYNIKSPILSSSSTTTFNNASNVKKTAMYTKNVIKSIDQTIHFIESNNSMNTVNRKLNKIKAIIEYLVQFFKLNTCIVDKALAFYTRNQSIYDNKYVAKKKIWAGACFQLACQATNLTISLKEISLSLNNIEIKKISKMTHIIKKYDETFLTRNKSAILSNDTSNVKKNNNAVARIALILNLSFNQQKLTKRIIAIINKEELISGLNPLSILSVSFFFTLMLNNANNDEQFVKQTLSAVSSAILIAINTIKKGIRESKDDVTAIMLKDASISEKVRIEKLRAMHI